MEPRETSQAKKEVAFMIQSYFEIGRNKELAAIPSFFAPPHVFTKFDDSPPYTRQNANEAFIHEQAKFANISDYQYKIDELRIDVVGDAAVATFYLAFNGVFVNDYSFEGRTVGARSRMTVIACRFGNEWKMVHQHSSLLPDVTQSAGPRPQA